MLCVAVPLLHRPRSWSSSRDERRRRSRARGCCATLGRPRRVVVVRAVAVGRLLLRCRRLGGFGIRIQQKGKKRQRDAAQEGRGERDVKEETRKDNGDNPTGTIQRGMLDDTNPGE